MTDMKEVPDEGMAQPTYAADAGPCYPYGLQISLCDSDLKKLGVDDLPEVGEEMTIQAKVLVTRTQDEQTMHGRCRNLGLQITAMDLNEIGKEADEKY